MTISLDTDATGGLHQVLLPVAITQCVGRTIVSFSGRKKLSIGGQNLSPSTNFSLGEDGLRALATAGQWARGLDGSHRDFSSRFKRLQTDWFRNAGVANIVNGALASWQLRLAIEALGERLDSSIELDDIARGCRISRAHFAKAFRRSVGIPPYRWRLELRLALARRALIETLEPLPQIAQSFGFQQTTHFCHAFVRATGMSPRQWRQTFQSKKWLGAHAVHAGQLQTLQMDFGEELFVHLELRHAHDDPTVAAIRALLVVALRREGWLDSSAEVLVEALHLYSVDARLVGKPYKTSQGPLAEWQVKLASRLLSEASEEGSIATVAAACGASPSYFSKAFRATLGVCPSRWQANARVERAKVLLENSNRMMIDIAGECGFSEQSHFNHTFTRLVGCNPGAWRTRHQSQNAAAGV